MTAGELAVFQRGMLSPHAIYVGLYIALTYAWSYLACLAIDLLLILIVDGISKGFVYEASRSVHRRDSSTYMRRSDVAVIRDLYIVGQHGVLCEVKLVMKICRIIRMKLTELV